MLRVLAICVALSACASGAAPPRVESPRDAATDNATPEGPAPGPERSPGAQGPEAAAAAAARDQNVSPEPPPGTKRLPSISVQNVGLHVGGGPNDAAGKAPFLRAVEQRFPEFLRCYRLIAEPGQSGTFGVDLHVHPRGGKPRVEQPRSGLTGEEFRACVVAVFASVDFEPVSRPTVVSYSLRFKVAEEE